MYILYWINNSWKSVLNSLEMFDHNLFDMHFVFENLSSLVSFCMTSGKQASSWAFFDCWPRGSRRLRWFDCHPNWGRLPQLDVETTHDLRKKMHKLRNWNSYIYILYIYISHHHLCHGRVLPNFVWLATSPGSCRCCISHHFLCYHCFFFPQACLRMLGDPAMGLPM